MNPSLIKLAYGLAFNREFSYRTLETIEHSGPLRIKITQNLKLNFFRGHDFILGHNEAQEAAQETTKII